MESNKVLRRLFDILNYHPDNNWVDQYYLLFDRSFRIRDLELCEDIFNKMLEIFHRHETAWFFKELEGDGKYKTFLDGLNYELPQVKEEISKEDPDKFHDGEPRNLQFREFSDQILCACCYTYVLSCEEIQEFPVRTRKSNVRNLFKKAMGQPEFHKRRFILECMLKSYAKKSPNIDLFLELWLKAETSGVHFSPFLREKSELKLSLLKPKNFKTFRLIIDFRHSEHDPLLQVLIDDQLKRENYPLAHYLNSKISTPYRRLKWTVWGLVKKEKLVKEDMIFLNRIYDSLKHDKIEDD